MSSSDEPASRRSRDVAALRTFGANVRRLRVEAGLTQEQLALHADLDMGNVSRYEGGQQEPGLTVMVRLARGLGVSPERLLDGVDSG